MLLFESHLTRQARMLKTLWKQFSHDLAIDLGTANTLVSVLGRGLLIDEPSVVAVAEGTNRILADGCAVGQLAKQMQGRTPTSMEVVRPMSGGVIADFQLCESMLKYFLNKVSLQPWQFKPRAMIAVPGSMTSVEKQAIYNSAQRCGLRQVYLVSEAKAAAIGVGLPIHEPVGSFVCDLGGGTTEIAVLSLGVIVAGKSIRIAGDAFDQAIVEYVRRQFSLKIGIATAEELKWDLGSAYPLEQELLDEVRGLDAVSGLPRKASITSEQIRQALAEPLEEIVEAIFNTLDQCSPDLAADLVEHGLVLCGGSALLRGLDRLLQERTGLPVRIAENALTAVAEGTAICFEQLEKWQAKVPPGEDVL